MGTPYFAQVILSALIGRYEVAAVVTRPDAQAGRGRKPSVPPVRILAENHGLPVLQPPRIGPEVVDQLRALRPTAIIVAAYGRILPAGLVSLPPRGCINVHASLLPRYRGAAPIPAAILAGDSHTGVTIMLMDEKMDTGPILSQEALGISPEDTTGSLTERLAHLGARLLTDTLPGWLSGEVTAHPQDDSQATYVKMLHRDDGRILWTEPADLIARRCRAYDPWPGTFTFWNQVELKIWQAHAHDVSPAAQPGTVVQLDHEVAVVTGHGVLVLDQLQLAGKRALSGQDFGRGQRHFVGSILQQPAAQTDKKENRYVDMHQVTLVVKHKAGLHARPAALFVGKAKQFKSKILVAKGDVEIDAKSILKILALGVNQGTVITIKAEGVDDEQAVKALQELVESNFGEPETHPQ
jgi:methionyl-tRNA formyltransferase